MTMQILPPDHQIQLDAKERVTIGEQPSAEGTQYHTGMSPWMPRDSEWTPERCAALLETPPIAKLAKLKPRYDLLPWEALADVLDVFEHGATVYSDDGWREASDERDCRNAAMRHLAADLRGDSHDHSGCQHVAHACARLLMVLAHRKASRDGGPINAHESIPPEPQMRLRAWAPSLEAMAQREKGGS